MAQAKTQETLKRLLYAGIGLAAEAAEKTQTRIDELVKKGHLSEKEGKKIVNDVVKKVEAQRAELESKVNDTVKTIVQMGEIEVGRLQKRIGQLETQLLKKAPAAKSSAKPAAKAAPKAAKKAAAKKAVAKKPAKKAAKKAVKKEAAPAASAE